MSSTEPVVTTPSDAETVNEEAAVTEPKPTDTVEFWKQKAREQEKRAKDNAGAAKELAEIREAQKSDAEKANDRVAKAEAEAASVPSKVAEALKGHLIELHQFDEEDAELFLTATEPELLKKQVSRLLERNGTRKKNIVTREGVNPNAKSAPDDMREFTRQLFGRDG